MRQLQVYHQADVTTLRRAIPELGWVPDHTIESYYEAYSDSYCAGWLIVDEQSIADFRRWLLDDDNC